MEDTKKFFAYGCSSKNILGLLHFMEVQAAVGVSIDYADTEEVFYEYLKNIIVNFGLLDENRIEQLDQELRRVVAQLDTFIANRERATGYSLWNIKLEHGGLYNFKQFVLTYKILDRIFDIIESCRYNQSQKDELKRMIRYFFYAALPEFITGRKTNPIHHNVQVLENMLLIVLAEKSEDFEFLKQSLVLALLHDVGNSRSSGVKVKGSVLKALKRDITNLEYSIKKAKTDAERNSLQDEKENLEKKLSASFNDTQDYRRSHMKTGAEMVRDLIGQFQRYVGHNIFEKTLGVLCGVVERHDNPSLAAYEREILGKVQDKALLFDSTDEFALYLREADRAWMVSPEGLEKDLMDEIEKSGSPEEKLAYNADAHRKEYVIYKENLSETKLAKYGFRDETLYHTERGYSLYLSLIRRTAMYIELSKQGEFSEDELLVSLYNAKSRIAQVKQDLELNKRYSHIYDLQSRLKNDCVLASKISGKITTRLRMRLKGKPIIIAILGPSGVGKATVIRYLVETYPEIFTRLVRVADRADIKETKDKELVSRKRFTDMEKAKEFLLTTGHYGHHYGITRREWRRARRSGKIILFDGLDSTMRILNMPELSKSVDIKTIGLYPADPNRKDLTEVGIEQRERERAARRPGSLTNQEIRERKNEGVAIVEAVRKIADETIINIPAFLSKEAFFRRVEQKIVSCLGLHNFTPVARRLNAKPSFKLEIPNRARLILRLREPGRSEISITHEMFNEVMKYLFDAGYIAEKFVMVPLETDGFGEEHYHRLLTAMQKGIQLDNGVSVIGLNLGAPFKASEINRYIANNEIMRDGVSFVVRRSTGKLMGDLDDGRAFMAWFQKRYCSPDGYSIVLLGAGPTNTAIALEMAKTNVAKICVTDTNYLKAQRLANRLKEMGVNAMSVEGVSLYKEIKSADVVINGTGIGKRPNSLGNPLIHNKVSYKDNAILVDLDYNLGPGNFLAQGKALNPAVEISNGVGFMIEYNSRQIAKIIGCFENDTMRGIVHNLVEKTIFDLLPSAKDIDWEQERTYFIDALPEQYYKALTCFKIPGIKDPLNADKLRNMIAHVSSQGGTRKTVYKITLKSGAEYILKKEPTKNRAAVNVSKFYRRNGVPYPIFICTNEGDSFAVVGQDVFTLQKVLQGRRVGRGNLSNMELTRIAIQLASIHRLSVKYKHADGKRAFKPGSDKNFLQVDQLEKIGECVSEQLKEVARELRKKGIDKKHPWRNKEKLKDFQELLCERKSVKAAIRYCSANLSGSVFGEFPRVFCVHGDFFQGNILMQNSTLSAVFDLERSKRHATRWEDLLTPMWELNYHTHSCGRSFDFGRFALWVTAYNRSLFEQERELALNESELRPESLKSLLLLGYLQELHKGLINRNTWVKPGYVMAQVRNIQDILKIDIKMFELLSSYLKNAMIWDEKVLESKTWLSHETSYMSALGLQVNSKVLKHCEEVIQWISNRLTKRCKVKIDEGMLADLTHELSEDGLSAFAKQGRLPAETQVEQIKKLIYQEAQLLRSAVPMMRYGAEFREVEIGLEPDILESMRQGRSSFYNMHEDLSDNMRHYWEKELPQYRGNIVSFGPACSPAVSIVIVSLASRLEDCLLKRLEELSLHKAGVPFEVNIVLADPQNIATTKLKRLKQLCKGLKFSIKLIESKYNTIATNRNLGSQLSRGKYIVFLDDDVKLVGNVIKSLVGTLDKYPEIGIAQAVSYDIDTGLHKPKSEYLKYAIDARTVISNDVAGMVMATRADIVRVLPFIPFWPNFGEDGWFGKQTQGLGFFLAFVYSDDAFVIHEHVQSRLTNDVNTIKNILIHDTLSYYLEPEYFDEMRDGKTIMRFQKFGDSENALSFAETKAFWLHVRNQVMRFLEGENKALSSSVIEDVKGKYGWAQKNADAVDHMAAFYRENERAVRLFKRDYNGKKLTPKINLFLGAFRYREREIRTHEDIMIEDYEKESEKADNALSENMKTVLRLAQNNEALYKDLVKFFRVFAASITDTELEKMQFSLCISGLSDWYNRDKNKDSIAIAKMLLKEVVKKYPVFSNGWLAEVCNGLDNCAKRFLVDISRRILRQPKRSAKVINLIMAGGKGESFYPLITKEKPKQLLRLNQFRGETLLEHVIDLAQSRGDNETFILASPEITPAVTLIASRKGIDEKHVLIDDVRFPGTASAIVRGLAYICKEFGPDAIVSIFNTDLDFENRKLFDQRISLAETVANLESSIIHIVCETFPHPSCVMVMPEKEKGFILGLSGCKTHFGKSDSIADAQRRVTEGALWYSGIRTGKVNTFLAAIEQTAPQYLKPFMLMSNAQSQQWRRAASEFSIAEFEEEAEKGFSETVIWPLLGAQDRIGMGLVKAPFGSHIGSLHYRIEHDRGIDKSNNALRLFNGSRSEQIRYERCRNCDFVINDETVSLYAYGLDGIVVAYDGTKKTILVVRSEDVNKSVKRIVRMLEDRNPSQHCRTTGKITASKRSNVYVVCPGNNIFYLENNGGVVFDNVENCIVYCKNSRQIALSGVKEIFIIHEGKNIYIYGPGYDDKARTHLGKIQKRKKFAKKNFPQISKRKQQLRKTLAVVDVLSLSNHAKMLKVVIDNFKAFAEFNCGISQRKKSSRENIEAEIYKEVANMRGPLAEIIRSFDHFIRMGRGEHRFSYVVYRMENISFAVRVKDADFQDELPILYEERIGNQVCQIIELYALFKYWANAFSPVNADFDYNYSEKPYLYAVASKQTIFMHGKKLVFEARIGQGHEGAVYKVREFATDKIYALKIGRVNLQPIYESWKKAVREIMNLPDAGQMLRPFLIEFNSYELASNSILMEYVESSKSFEDIYLQGRRNVLETLRALSIIEKISRVLGILYKNNIRIVDAHSNNIMCRENSDSCKLIDPSTSCDKNVNLEYKNIFKMGVSLYRLFSVASFDEEEVSDFRKALEKGIVDFKEAQSIFDLRDLGYIDQRLRKIILKSLFMTDVYYKSMIALAEDLKTFLQAIIGPNGIYEIAEYCDRRVPNTYPLKVPDDFTCPGQHTQADVTLFRNTYFLQRATKGSFLPKQRQILSSRLNQLTSITRRGPPQVTFVVTTDKVILKKMNDMVAAVNLGHAIDSNLPQETVFLHPYFFTLSRQKQIEILYHELISHIYKGIRDEKEAMRDTEEFFRLRPLTAETNLHLNPQLMSSIKEAAYEEVCIITAGGGGDVLGAVFLARELQLIFRKMNKPHTKFTVITTNLKRGAENVKGGLTPISSLGCRDINMNFKRIPHCPDTRHFYCLNQQGIKAEVKNDDYVIEIPIKEGMIIESLNEWGISLLIVDLEAGSKRLADDYLKLVGDKKVLTVGIDMGGDVLARYPKTQTKANRSSHPERGVRSPVTDTVILGMLCALKQKKLDVTLAVSALGGDGELGEALLSYLPDFIKRGEVEGVIDNHSLLAPYGREERKIIEDTLTLDIASEVSLNFIRRLKRTILGLSYRYSFDEREEMVMGWEGQKRELDVSRLTDLCAKLPYPLSGRKIRNNTRTEVLPALYLHTLFMNPLDIEAYIAPGVRKALDDKDSWYEVEQYFREELGYYTEMNDPNNIKGRRKVQQFYRRLSLEQAQFRDIAAWSRYIPIITSYFSKAEEKQACNEYLVDLLEEPRFRESKAAHYIYRYLMIFVFESLAKKANGNFYKFYEYSELLRDFILRINNERIIPEALLLVYALLRKGNHGERIHALIDRSSNPTEFKQLLRILEGKIIEKAQLRYYMLYTDDNLRRLIGETLNVFTAHRREINSYPLPMRVKDAGKPELIFVDEHQEVNRLLSRGSIVLNFDAHSDLGATVAPAKGYTSVNGDSFRPGEIIPLADWNWASYALQDGLAKYYVWFPSRYWSRIEGSAGGIVFDANSDRTGKSLKDILVDNSTSDVVITIDLDYLISNRLQRCPGEMSVKKDIDNIIELLRKYGIVPAKIIVSRSLDCVFGGMVEMTESRLKDSFNMFLAEQRAADNFGTNDLVKASAALDRAEFLVSDLTMRKFWQINRSRLKNRLEQLTRIIKQGLPAVTYIITTDPEKLGIDPESGMPYVAACQIAQGAERMAHSVVYIHPYFFDISQEDLQSEGLSLEQLQCKILYHELISHIYKGIRDERKAMEDTRLFLGQPQPDCLGSLAFTAAKRMKAIYQRICHGIYLLLKPLFVLSKKVNVYRKVKLPLTKDINVSGYSMLDTRYSMPGALCAMHYAENSLGKEEQRGATSPVPRWKVMNLAEKALYYLSRGWLGSVVFSTAFQRGVAGPSTSLRVPLVRLRSPSLEPSRAQSRHWGPSPAPLSQRDFTGPTPVSSLKMANNRRIAAFTIPEVLLFILALGVIAGTILAATIPRDLKAGLFLPIYIGVAGLVVFALSRLRVMAILKHYAPCPMPHADKLSISRRSFLRTAAVAVAGLVTAPSVLAAEEEDYLAAEEDNTLAEENDRPRALEIIDGVYYIFGEPSQFRGLTWYPVSKGQSRQEMNYKTSSWQQDIALMKNLRINTVRVYCPIYSWDHANNRTDTDFVNNVLDTFYDAGIGVIMGFPYYDDRYAWGPDISAGRIGQFPGLVTIGDYIAAFCEHPAVMMWELGNEYNIHPEWFGGNTSSWYAELKEVVAEIRLIDSSRPVSTVLAEKEDGELKEDINKCRDCGVDIIGMNLYNWNDPSEFIKKWPQLSASRRGSMAMYLSEAGTDSYDNISGTEQQRAQAGAVVSIWEHVRHLSDYCKGVAFMGFCDDWGRMGNPYSQDTGGWPLWVPYDNFANEEYWGWYTIDREPKFAAEVMQVLWDYEYPENNRSSGARGVTSSVAGGALLPAAFSSSQTQISADYEQISADKRRMAGFALPETSISLVIIAGIVGVAELAIRAGNLALLAVLAAFITVIAVDLGTKSWVKKHWRGPYVSREKIRKLPRGEYGIRIASLRQSLLNKILLALAVLFTAGLTGFNCGLSISFAILAAAGVAQTLDIYYNRKRIVSGVTNWFRLGGSITNLADIALKIGALGAILQVLLYFLDEYTAGILTASLAPFLVSTRQRPFLARLRIQWSKTVYLRRSRVLMQAFITGWQLTVSCLISCFIPRKRQNRLNLRK
ncbi:MAG: DUF1152 domain-containing protein [Deltaproteobacteria bacterium]|nr:DUF1152 domain-containing protein [Deltaproteobacteria bacterium]